MIIYAYAEEMKMNKEETHVKGDDSSAEKKSMKNSFYEAVILGDDLAALFAGYLLKKNRIRFVIAERNTKLDDNVSRETLCGFEVAETKTDNQNQGSFEFSKHEFTRKEEKTSEISEDGKIFVKKIYHKLTAQVGSTGNLPLGTDEKSRFAVLLRSSLRKELENIPKITTISVKEGTALLTSDETVLETDNLIWTPEHPVIDELSKESESEDILKAGIWAQSIVEQKQRRMEEDMKRLRIKAGKRNTRKMVYATHSKSWFYAKEVVIQFAVKQGVAAVNPFMNYGFYLNEMVKKDEIVECCHQLIRTADELWVFGPVSEAILTDIAVAVMEGKEIRFFSISDQIAEIHELHMDDVVFEREVHAGQIRKSDLLNFIGKTVPKMSNYVQMSLFDTYAD